MLRPRPRLTPVSSFPPGYFLENLAVRADNSVLITALNQRQLWYVPPAGDGQSVEPVLLHTFEQLTVGLAEVDPDVFYLCTSNVYTDHKSSLHIIDLRGWSAGKPVEPRKVLDFSQEAGALNGVCLVGPRTLLVANSLAGLIWRVELSGHGDTGTAQVWLRHESMGNFPGRMKPEQPGINGVRYAKSLGFLYYTATAKKLFMRVPVDPGTLAAAGEPEHVSAGRMADDFCIDEDAGVAYLTTHRENTIDCVSLDPSRNSDRHIVAGDPPDESLIGPSSAAWGRRPGDYGKVAFVTTDGGAAAPPPGGPRPAMLLRVQFAEVPEALRSMAPRAEASHSPQTRP